MAGARFWRRLRPGRSPHGPASAGPRRPAPRGRGTGPRRLRAAAHGPAAKQSPCSPIGRRRRGVTADRSRRRTEGYRSARAGGCGEPRTAHALPPAAPGPPPSRSPAGAGAVTGACPRSRRQARPPVRVNKAPTGRESPGGKAPAAPLGLLLCLGPRRSLAAASTRSPASLPLGLCSVPVLGLILRLSAAQRALEKAVLTASGEFWCYTVVGFRAMGEIVVFGAESEFLTQKRGYLPSCLSLTLISKSPSSI